jgi:hypothetical protein
MSFLGEDGAAIRVEQGEPLLITEAGQWGKTSWLVGLLAQGQEVSACLDRGDIVPLEEWQEASTRVTRPVCGTIAM